jgi:hypothetical protein
MEGERGDGSAATFWEAPSVDPAAKSIQKAVHLLRHDGRGALIHVSGIDPAQARHGIIQLRPLFRVWKRAVHQGSGGYGEMRVTEISRVR